MPDCSISPYFIFAIGIVVEGYQLARAPAPSEVFSREFLPPRAERELVYTTN
ncbi:MAG TPA: hypothetical protein VK620_15975 [Bradyrhizobium sp.]|nr:hypothetical protein [Bradyrhizobium sp.]